MSALTRRRLLAAGVPVMGLGAALHAGGGHARGTTAVEHGLPAGHEGRHGARGTGHAAFRGEVDHGANGFDPQEILRAFDTGTTHRLPGGRVLREWTVTAADRTLQVAPGIEFPAWTFDGRIPGPTLRAREGERLRIRFQNGSRHAHTMHFHGIHTAANDGTAGIGPGEVAPGEERIYEFDAEPFGLHVYHCHVRPLAEHIAKGMYGTFIIDPAQGRPEADELVMVMNGFDTNFDRSNELYAVNSIGFAYMDRPVRVRRGELVRIFLVNALEYDLLNSFHIHGNFFHYFPTGTSLEPAEYTDTVMQCQGQRGILELRFPNTGRYMFHAHQSEFTELGWMGLFEVVDA